jgi:2-polyprenyl-3-methyl-5-hydroxy-6-metoxy-1,4-benzoquinol methylase
MGQYLRDKGLIGDNINIYYSRTRDRPDIAVYICRDTDVIFLDVPIEALHEHYRSKEIENDGRISASNVDGTKITTATLQDSERRFVDFRDMIANRVVCDFGTGHGLFLRRASESAAVVCGVELSELHLTALHRDGFTVERSIMGYREEYFDVVTMFHVLEHLPRPIETLMEIRTRMKPDAKLIVEVPHARDFLHRTLESDSFKKFTFWSEHLVLHTSESLRRILTLAGFNNVITKGYQRYGLENHLYWLVKQKPGGHTHWHHLHDKALNAAYTGFLQSIGQTDTLVAFASA